MDFHEIWYLSIFRKICRENSSFIKIWQEKRVLYIKTYVLYIKTYVLYIKTYVLYISDHISLISS